MPATRPISAQIVMTITGMVLIAAALLKLHQLITAPIPATVWVDSPALQILWAPCEILLGTMLILGAWRAWTRWAAVACFAVFTVVTAWRAWRGDPSCGCFGVITVDPRITLILDLGILLGLILLRPTDRWRPRRWDIAALAIVLVVVPVGIIPLCIQAWHSTPTTLNAHGDVVGGGRLVILEPAAWRGRPWPLLAQIDRGSALRTGDWRVVLFRHDCPHCRTAVPERLATWRAHGVERIMAVSLPPHGDPNPIIGAAPEVVSARIAATHDWFIATPVFLSLDNGTVIALETDQDPLSQRLAALDAHHLPRFHAQDTGIDLGHVLTNAVIEAAVDLGAARDRTPRLYSECACIVPGTPRATAGTLLAPFLFVAPDHPVDYDKRLLVVAADGRQDVIRIRARVGMPIQAPRTVRLPRRLSERILHVINHAHLPVRLLFASAGRGWRVTLPPLAIEPGAAAEVPVRALSDAPETALLRIATNLPEQAELVIQLVITPPDP